jgi:hypothetical protein
MLSIQLLYMQVCHYVKSPDWKNKKEKLSHSFIPERQFLWLILRPNDDTDTRAFVVEGNFAL